MWATKHHLLVIALLFSGCNQETRRFPLEGTVTLDGKPIKECMLVFKCCDKSDSANVSIATVERGAFYVPASEGLPIGEYQVIVNQQQPDAEAYERARLSGIRNPIRPNSIPIRYTSKSPLRVVVSEASIPITLALQSRP